MSRPATLTKTRIRSGVWEGILIGPATRPELQVTLQGAPITGIAVAKVQEGWAVSVPIPAEVLNEGVQTFLIRDAAEDRVLAHFTIVTGVAMEDDLRAEIDLLRTELDLLKRAFRRHCHDTGADQASSK